MANKCENCMYWQPRYAPHVRHGVPYVKTCILDKDCRGAYWRSKKEDINETGKFKSAGGSV